jgi:two-component system LytT family sensor kinase
MASVSESPQERARRWLWISAIWLGLGLLDASQTVFPMQLAGMHHNWGALFFIKTVTWLPWALATPLIIATARRYPTLKKASFEAIRAHVTVILMIGLGYSVWDAFLDVWLNPWANPEPRTSLAMLSLYKFTSGLLTVVVLYAFVFATTFAIDYRERIARQQLEAARLNEQLSIARLKALRHQMEPHFVFNALNAIAALIRDHRSDEAVTAVVGLSDLLRRAAEDSNRSQVTLADEMEYLERYLEIQKVRFADRLQVAIEVPPALLSATVPSLSLQPLVENAIKHGIAKNARGGVLQIKVSRSESGLDVNIYNDGPTLPADWESRRHGVGLTNLRARLQILYGDKFALTLRNEGDTGVNASLHLPLAEAA